MVVSFKPSYPCKVEVRIILTPDAIIDYLWNKQVLTRTDDENCEPPPPPKKKKKNLAKK